MMSPEDFRAWRKALGWKQKEAAERLGLRKRMIQYYEKGNRDGKDVRIPKTVRLACYALAEGVDDFDGVKARAFDEAAAAPAPASAPTPAETGKAPDLAGKKAAAEEKKVKKATRRKTEAPAPG